MRPAAGRGAPETLPSDPRALGDRLAGAPLAVLLDVDGTLAPIAPRPEDAAVPPDTVAALRALVARPHTHVGFVSGRGAVDARRLVGVDGVWAAGNHGFEILDPDGTLAVAPEVGPWEFALAAARERIRPLVAATPGALLEDKGATMSVHYRLRPAFLSEELTPLDTPTVYGLSKGFGELICQYFARWWDMNLIALRITGPRTREQYLDQRRNPPPT